MGLRRSFGGSAVPFPAAPYLAGLLALLLVVVALPQVAVAAEEETPDDGVEEETETEDVATSSLDEDGSVNGAPVSEEDELQADAESDDPSDAADARVSSDGDDAQANGSDAAVLAVEDQAVRAAGPPVFEITGSWLDQPDSIARGEPVVAEWRVNVNDSEEPPANEPVDNVLVDFNLTSAFFDDIPDLCRTGDVDPPSSISEGGRVLTCNLGTVNMGTAVLVQTPVVADGNTGEEVTHDGTIDGQTVDLPPIPIVNDFLMDMQWSGASNFRGRWDDVSDPAFVDVDLQWSLRLGQGSDVGPDEVTYTLNVTDVDGSPLEEGVHFRTDEVGCTRFDANRADGHPWSRIDLAPDHPRQDSNTSFVDECSLEQVGANTFTLTLRGINYDLSTTPELDSWQVALPTDWHYIASGSLWFRVHTSSAGSVTLTANAPTYEAPTGQTFTDLVENNTSNKTYTLPGGFSASYQRGFTSNGGSDWDDTYRTSPGTTVRHRVGERLASHNAAPGDTFGKCLTFDYAFVRWDPSEPVIVEVIGNDFLVEAWDPLPGELQYYIGDHPLVTPGSGAYDPDQFECSEDPGGWTTDPLDPSEVKAVRHLHPFSAYSDWDAQGSRMFAHTRINDGVPVGQDIWMFGSILGQNGWVGPQAGNQIALTPDARYEFTTGRRDILRIITATPNLQKWSGQATVTPGVPADFTLRYAATGTGSIPDTVDGYQVIDTLPVGMTYVEGSADPDPEVTTNAQGQQVLTWTFDGVDTNVWHEFPYQAVPDSGIEPGQRLTNVAFSSFEGATSPEREATVTSSTNGFTTILKTSDVEYIPNRFGDGVGTGSWTVTIESFDPLPQAFTDTIDILPYNGDPRGTSFSGSYHLDEVVTPDGGIVYYTDADPATVNMDPADESNGAAGDPTGNDIGWTTEVPESPTAVRVIGGELPPGGSFEFQVVITTEGAQPRDVYWNSAQARAEHTELVMRTSAALIVTDYEVIKVSDPASGSIVDPGEVIHYTITVTQIGDVPAGAVLVDDLSQVLDDAVYNGDVEADIGMVSIDGDQLSWEGEIPVGGVATITYSVTLKDADGIEAEGDAVLRNVVTSPGCRPPDHCTTTHSAGRYAYNKTSDPAPGQEVQAGEVVTYRLEIATTFGRVEDAIVVDDMSDLLDDATWNDDLQVSSGEAVLEGTTLTWSGDVEVDEVVVVSYSVTVTGDGNGALHNVLSSPDVRSECVDENPGCATAHALAAASDPPPEPSTSTPASRLPRTGADILWLAVVGVLLALAGASLAWQPRRRRHPTSSG